MRRIAWILLASTACTTQTAPPPPDDVQIVQRIAFDSLIEHPDIVGVSTDPNTQEVVFTDAYRGIYRLDGTHITDIDFGLLSGEITDGAAMGSGQYALTIPSSGLLYDSHSRELSQYFCYVPMVDSGDIEYEITNGLTFDAQNQKLIAQPQSFVNDTVQSSQVAQFGLDGGQPDQWDALKDTEFSAGGLAADEDGLLLGQGAIIYSYQYGRKKVKPLVDMSSLGVTQIDGMALMENGHLLLVDSEDQEFIELAGWRE